MKIRIFYLLQFDYIYIYIHINFNISNSLRFFPRCLACLATRMAEEDPPPPQELLVILAPMATAWGWMGISPWNFTMVYGTYMGNIWINI